MPKPLIVQVNPEARPLPIVTIVVHSFCKPPGCKEKVVLSKRDNFRIPKIKLFPSREEIIGDLNVGRYLARTCGRYGSDDFVASQIDSFVDIAVDIMKDKEDSANNLSDHCEILNHHLIMRTFFVGQDFTFADMTIWSALKVNKKWSGLMNNLDKFGHLVRWFNFCEQSSEFIEAKAQMVPRRIAKNRWKVQISNWKKVKEVPIHTKPDVKSKRIGTVNIRHRLDELERSEDGKWLRHQNGWSPMDIGGVTCLKPIVGGSWDINLKQDEDWQGKVVTRFPPEPSGYLHIGHCKAVLLNAEISRQYDGKMIVRFDDTNPSKEKGEYMNSIKQDLATLKVKIDKFSHTSDYFDFLIEVCEDMLRRGVAYVDFTPVEEMRAERMKGVESACRNHTPEENLALWEQMKEATEQGKTCCVRAKMDMSAKNKTLCDPTMYRVNTTPHIRTGNKYNVYPTYDFACPVVDSLEGVTHALRTTEYHDRNAQYDYMFDLALGHKNDEYKLAKIWGYSRLNFQNTVMSKRKLTWFVKMGHVRGWDDPRMPTIQGLFNRGLTLDAMREFVYSMAASRAIVNMEWDIIWTKNKKIIDPECGRYLAISTKGIPFVLRDGPELSAKTVNLHPKRPELGKNTIFMNKRILVEPEDAISFDEGEEITLMNWGNAVVEKKIVNESGDIISLEGRLNLDGDVKSTKKKISWIADTEGTFAQCRVTLVTVGNLITVPTLTDDMKLEDVVNKNSWIETEVFAEPAVRNLEKGMVIQFQRRGYYIVESISLEQNVPVQERGPELVCIQIPDGKSQQ